jgi:uncharacterized membrane-anchored protein
VNEPGHNEQDTERYEFSGIEERRGGVPKWLLVVYLVMFVWMICYLIKYWTDHG